METYDARTGMCIWSFDVAVVLNSFNIDKYHASRAITRCVIAVLCGYAIIRVSRSRE